LAALVPFSLTLINCLEPARCGAPGAAGGEQSGPARRDSGEREGQPAPQDKAALEAMARALDAAGLKQFQQGKFADATRTLQEALALYRKLYLRERYPDGHPELATALSNLAAVLRSAGEMDKARDYCEQALAMDRALYPKAKFPDGHPDVAIDLNNLGALLEAAGDFEQARGYYEQALAMRRALYPKAKYPEGHPQLATSLRNLGGLLFRTGEYEQARDYTEQALAMQRTLFPKAKYPAGHPDLAMTLNNLGSLLRSAGQYGQARESYEEALAMWRALYPKAKYPAGHPDLAMTLNNLGGLSKLTGQYEQARDYYEQALAMNRALYPQTKHPAGHPKLAIDLNNLGQLLEAQRRYDQARGCYEQALAMWRVHYPETKFPDGHPDLARTLINLGSLLHDSGRPDEALGCLHAAVKMLDSATERYATLVAEAQALRFLASLPSGRDVYLTAAVTARAPAVEVYAALWPSKGLLSRLLARRHQATRVALRGDEKARTAWAELLDVRGRLAPLLLQPGTDAAARDKELARLTQRKEKLERDLAKLLPELERAERLRGLGPADLAERLPAGAAFVDLLRYRHSGKAGQATDKYLAFVLGPDKAVRFVELGDADPIQRVVRAWRGNIDKRKDNRADAQEVAARVWGPIAKELPAGTTTFYLAPDGELARLPWAALPGKDPAGVLLDELAIAVVPHGPFLLEQLLYPPSYPAGTEAVLGLGEVDYGSAAAPVYPALPGTAAELAKLSELAGLGAGRELMLLRKAEARWDKLKELLPRARYAHLATHGFFDQQAMALEYKRHQAQIKQFQPGQTEAGLGVRSPLVFTGLVLAGANLPPQQGGGEVVVTGEGLVGLPLEGLRLCVLSACESGLGDLGPLSGEGVQGLPRALHLAGCANVVSSLWRVDDAATAALMAKLYDGLWRQGLAPAEALRQAQLTVYRHPDWVAALADRGPTALKKLQIPPDAKAETGRAAPTKLWAAFVLSGAGR
jgi:CHAT domain-containing protein/Tfp pilus assembly protein PilF